MSDVVDISGQPVAPEVPYDIGLVQILQRAIENVKAGLVIGVAVVEVVPEHDRGSHEWGTNCSYHGPRLSLLAGCYRMAHNLQIALDERQRKTGR